MKVKVILETKNVSMNQVLPLGFETEIEPILHEDDKSVTKHHRLKDGSIRSFENVVWNKGDFKDYRFVGANGQTYDGSFIKNSIGYKSLKDVFEKIN